MILTALNYGWQIVSNIVLGATIYTANNTNQFLAPQDTVEIVLAAAERDLATERGEYGGEWGVEPLTYVLGSRMTNGAGGYVTNNTTNVISWFTDHALMLAIDAYIVDPTTIFVNTNTLDALTVTGIFDTLQIGDKTNLFTASPIWTNPISTNWIVNYTSYWPSTNGTSTNISYTSTVYHAINFAQSWTATGGWVWVTETNWPSAVVQTTNAATYGAWPWQMHKIGFEDRYKFLNALETTKPDWATTYKEVYEGVGYGLTAADAYNAAVAAVSLTASGALPSIDVEQTCQMILWSNYTYKTSGGGGGGGSWVYPDTNLVVAITNNVFWGNPWPATTNRFTIGTGTLTGVVRDNLKPRIWIRDTHKGSKMTWPDATNYASTTLNTNAFCGYTNWVVGGYGGELSGNLWTSLRENTYELPALSDTEGDAQWTEGNPFQNVSWTTNIWLQDSQVERYFYPSTNYNGKRSWWWESGTNWIWVFYDGTNYQYAENGGVFEGPNGQPEGAYGPFFSHLLTYFLPETNNAYWYGTINDGWLVDPGVFAGALDRTLYDFILGYKPISADPSELHWAWFSCSDDDIQMPGPDPSGVYTGAPPCWIRTDGSWVCTNSGVWYITQDADALDPAWTGGNPAGEYDTVVGTGITGTLFATLTGTNEYWDAGGGEPAPPGYGMNTWNSNTIFYQCWLTRVWATATAYGSTSITHRAASWDKLLAPNKSTADYTANLNPTPSEDVPAISVSNEYYDQGMDYDEGVWKASYDTYKTNWICPINFGDLTSDPVQSADPSDWNEATCKGFRCGATNMTMDWKFLYATNKYW